MNFFLNSVTFLPVGMLFSGKKKKTKYKASGVALSSTEGGLVKKVKQEFHVKAK